MKQAQFFIIFLVIYLISGPTFAASSAKVVASLKKKEKTYSQSVLAVRVSDRKEILSFQKDKLLTPASTTKLFTAAAVLKKFSPQHQFKTVFYHTGFIKNGWISGDLVIRGVGDPYIISEKLWQLSADFRNMGIKGIQGDIVIDNSFFDGLVRGGMRNEGIKSSTHAYDAPVSAFGVNFNTLAIVLSPSYKSGFPARVSIDPYNLKNIIIENKLKTTSEKSKFSIERKSRNNSSRLIAKGSIAMKDKIVKKYRSVGDHIKSSGEIVRSFLKSEGIEVKGDVKTGVVKKNARSLYELNSYPMAMIVEGLNKFSNNYIADVLLKDLGQFKSSSKLNLTPGIGTFENGLSVIKNFLKNEVSIRSKFVLENGSGLTTENKINAAQMCKLLVYMSKNMDVFPEFLASLPASGLDGTLRKRFNEKSTRFLKGKIRAKTGTLSNPISVSALAGYMQHPKHGLVAFTIIQNGIEGRKKQPSILSLRSSQDNLVAKIYSNL